MAETIFAEQTVTGFSYNSGYGCYFRTVGIPAPFSLESGETYTVIWDGVAYTVVAFAFYSEGVNFVGVGNKALAGMAQTSEPFGLSYRTPESANGDGLFAFAMDAAYSHTLAVYKATPGIVLKNRDGESVTHEGVENGINVLRADGTEALYVDSAGVPEPVETTVAADFSDGYMIIEPETGKLFSKVTVMAPVDGGGGLVDYHNELATTASKSAYSGFQGVRSMTFTSLTTLNGNTFAVCNDLEKLDFRKLASIDSTEFSSCNKLTALIIRTNSMCVIRESSNLSLMFTGFFQAKAPIDAGTGYIYVPASLVATYQADANWDQWKTQFRAIEDYPDICG